MTEAKAPDPHTVRPPNQCPDVYLKRMGTLINCEASRTMQNHKVPWHIISQMVMDDYTTDKELAERWLTKESARADSAKELGFDTMYDPKDVKLYAMRLAHAVEAASEAKHQPLTDTLEEQHKHERKIETKDRKTLLNNIQKAHCISKKDMPKRYEQGSDHFLALQYLEISKGNLGDFPITKMAPYKPDHQKSTKTANKRSHEKDKDGYTRVTEEEYQPAPRDIDTWKTTMLIHRWTLLMCLSAFPEQTQLQITKDQLDEDYDWLYGDTIANRKNNPPSVSSLRFAERAAWSRLNDILDEHWDEGMTLPQALDKLKADNLWWQNIFDYNSQQQQQWQDQWTSNNYYRTKGKGKGKSKGKGKGKYKGKGKGKKGRGKSKTQWNPNTNNWQYTNQTFANRMQQHQQQPPPVPPTQPTTTSYKPPPCPNPIKCSTSQFSPHPCPTTGRPFCRNYHVRSCPGNCGRSHNCPYIDSSGHVCNARPGQCNHRFQ